MQSFEQRSVPYGPPPSLPPAVRFWLVKPGVHKEKNLRSMFPPTKAASSRASSRQGGGHLVRGLDQRRLRRAPPQELHAAGLQVVDAALDLHLPGLHLEGSSRKCSSTKDLGMNWWLQTNLKKVPSKHTHTHTHTHTCANMRMRAFCCWLMSREWSMSTPPHNDKRSNFKPTRLRIHHADHTSIQSNFWTSPLG